MNPSLLKSLTPFTASGLDSRGLYIWCVILNVIYCLAAVCTISIFAIEDPWELGWITSGALALIVYLVIGFLIQVGRNAAVKKNVKAYNQFVNATITLIHIENIKTKGVDDSRDNQDIEPSPQADISDTIPLIDFSEEEINNVENPFISDDVDLAFEKILSPIQNHSIKSDSAKAIAEAIVEINNEVSPRYKRLKKEYNHQKYVILWLCKKYFKKLSTDKYNTIYSAKKSDMYKEEWKEKLKPLFGLIF